MFAIVNVMVDISLEYYELKIVCADVDPNGHALRVTGYYCYYRSVGCGTLAIDYM